MFGTACWRACVHCHGYGQAWVSCADHSYTLGSSDATTCVIVVIVCHGARRAWCAHHDANTVRRGWGGGALADGVRQWGLEGQAADVYLVGAFQEASGVSAAVAHGVLAALRKCPLRLTVRLACILHANTTPAGGPASLHVAVDAASGAAHPATFADRGPELPRRMAYAMMRPDDDELPQVYRADEHRLVLPGFSWRVPARVVDHFRRSLEQSDADFLLYNSTSPEHEPPNFVDDVKAQYRCVHKLVTWCCVHACVHACVTWNPSDGRMRKRTS